MTAPEDNPTLNIASADIPLEQELEERLCHYNGLTDDTDMLEKAQTELDIAECYLGLEQKSDAYIWVNKALPVFKAEKEWAFIIDAGDIIYNCGQQDATVALGNGTWLAMALSTEPNITINLLHYIIEAYPNDADRAAVAAMLAHFVAETRSSDQERENLSFLTGQIIVNVAEKHYKINDQEALNTWITTHKLDDINHLLQKLDLILIDMTNNQWWYDKDQIHAELPNG